MSKAKGILTEKQKIKLRQAASATLSKKAKTHDQRKVLKTARERVNPALEDLDFLLKLPSLDFMIDPKLIIKLIEAYLIRPEFNITEAEQLRIGLPRGNKKEFVLLKMQYAADYTKAVATHGESSEEAKNYSLLIKSIDDALSSLKGKKLIQFGELKNKTQGHRGAPLMKKLGEKYGLIYEIVQKLYDLRDFGGFGPLTIIDEGDGKFSSNVHTNLTVWLGDRGMVDTSTCEKYEKLVEQEGKFKAKTGKSPNHVVLWRY